MEGIKRPIEKVIELLSEVGVIIIIALMLLIVADVFMRNIFLLPIKGTIEISMFMMATLTSLGLAFCTLRGGNINVELISSFLSKKANYIVDKINYIIIMVYLLAVVIQLSRYAMFAARLGSSSDRLRIPIEPFIYITAFGFFMMLLTVAIKFHSQSLEQKKAGEDTEGYKDENDETALKL